MRLTRLSLLTRITTGSLLIALLISGVVGILLYSQIHRIVLEGEMAILVGIEAPYRTALADEPKEPLDRPGAGQLVAIVDPAGAIRLDTLPAPLGATLPELLTKSDRTSETTAGGATYLVRIATVSTSIGDWQIISARDTRAQSAVLGQVTALLIGSILVLNLGYGAASWLIATAALRPVSRLRTSAENLVARPGNDLLPVGPAHDEIARLAQTLNVLVSDLRASAARERQIVSDASHELRTPLAVLQTQLELAQAPNTSLDQMTLDVAGAQRTLTRLSALATSLLELSRIDAQSVQGSATVEALAGELVDAVDRARGSVGVRDVQIDFDAVVEASEDRVPVSAPDFGRIIDNLLQNSLAAVGTRGQIDVRLEQAGRGVLLTVSDDGPGMDEAFMPHATERFARADSSRGGSGAGLGLAIVAGIVTVAGGRLELSNRPGGGLTATAAFPLAAPS
jgi:two-component system OmpR family sensor kinase